jgi:hypothetical protein
MHRSQKEWCECLKDRFPLYFACTKVLDVGSLDVNGTNRHLFHKPNYVGIDVVEGPGVDVVCKGHEFVAEKKFDVVLSTNALEHDMFWFLTLPQMIRLLKPRGLMFFSCSYSYRHHGTKSVHPGDSGTTKLKGDWGDYYRNLKLMDIYSVMTPERSFSTYMMGISGRDLRFWGIKKK